MDEAQTPVASGLHARLRELADLIAASPHNLVSRADRTDVYGIHIQECLAYVEALEIEPGSRWIDVGTGGGLPGLVLAAARPDTHWTLVDGTAKKVHAVRRFAQALNLNNVRVVHAQAEELAHDLRTRASFDGAISRAVAALPTLVELLAGLVRPDGQIVAVKGPRWPDELEAAQKALEILGIRWQESKAISAAPRPTWLVMMRLRGPVPATFPRRSGLPRTSPLGGT